MPLPVSSDISTYGAPYTDAIPAQDPTSELAASPANQMFADVAAMTRTSPRLILQFTGSATAPALSATTTWATGWDSLWGNASGYNPTLTRNSTGNITLQIPSSITDSLGNTQLPNLRTGKGCVCGSTAGSVQVLVTSASTATVYLFNAAGSPNDLAGTLCLVELF
jgi:hypothetical protein